MMQTTHKYRKYSPRYWLIIIPVMIVLFFCLPGFVSLWQSIAYGLPVTEDGRAAGIFVAVFILCALTLTTG